ncbi:vitellogenin-1 [Bactrocera dorsalis]|uniref:Vitellogenin-1 n=1 Tax=Bactrocera dorsalis TaxID=27457 RepID=A0A6I9UWI9_BACDO|nr:vitellogenin-1 [Bactrocera dorsalis]
MTSSIVRLNIIIPLLLLFNPGTEAGLINIFAGTINIAAGVVSTFIPTSIFSYTANKLIGFSLTTVAGVVDKICTIGLRIKKHILWSGVDLTQIKFQLRTACSKYTYSLRDAWKLLNNSDFHPSRKVVIMVSGWTQTVNHSDTIDKMATVFNCRGDVNFLALDMDQYLNTFYTWAVQNTDSIALGLAQGLTMLKEVIPIENIQLIGHSLGAHIVGQAGRFFTEKTGEKLPYITGLDPAKTCLSAEQRIGRDDAHKVEILHTNPGVLGIAEPLGHIDLYASYLRPHANGCWNSVCSHTRAVDYYVEFLYPGNKSGFLAKRCASWEHLRAEQCTGKNYAMGNIDYWAEGEIYALDLNPQSPFGRDSLSKYGSREWDCGLCQR